VITGLVNADLEAIVRLTVQGPGESSQPVDAVIDTGFSGFLTLPPSLITSLGLLWLCRQGGILADGSMRVFDVYSASVLWEGETRAVETEAVEAQPLAGMALLHGSEVRLQVVDGGTVTIVSIP
jgi:clan AA aspartic protease